jgi:hypothetical protein
LTLDFLEPGLAMSENAVNVYSPIALFVYNRPRHTMQVLEALSRNPEAIHSDLFIYSDGAADSSSISAVNEVRSYIRDYSGFKSILIVEHQKNNGLANSILGGVTNLLNRFGTLIVLEDDLVVSPTFLKYMNSGLDFYRNDQRVGSIHGYTYPTKESLPETFFLRGGDCWGWATWSRAWKHINLDGIQLLKELEERGLSKEFDFDGAYPYMKMLKNQIKGKNNSWAVRWHASLFLKNMLTLYPRKSLVQNIGHDGTGVHSASTNYLSVVLSDIDISIFKISISENTYARSVFKQFLWRGHSSPVAILRRAYYKLRNYLNLGARP